MGHGDDLYVWTGKGILSSNPAKTEVMFKPVGVRKGRPNLSIILDTGQAEELIPGVETKEIARAQIEALGEVKEFD